MHIEYSVSHDGHFIHTIIIDPVTGGEFVEYEVAHATDDRIKPPVSELLEIQNDALRNITKDDISRVLQRRAELKNRHIPHRCAIVVLCPSAHTWDLAKFYERMVMLHSPEIVIVFGDIRTAKIWLGIEYVQPDKADAADTKSHAAD